VLPVLLPYHLLLPALYPDLHLDLSSSPSLPRFLVLCPLYLNALLSPTAWPMILFLASIGVRIPHLLWG
jgi:hypothetical protein